MYLLVVGCSAAGPTLIDTILNNSGSKGRRPIAQLTTEILISLSIHTQVEVTILIEFVRSFMRKVTY